MLDWVRGVIVEYLVTVTRVEVALLMLRLATIEAVERLCKISSYRPSEGMGTVKLWDAAFSLSRRDLVGVQTPPPKIRLLQALKPVSCIM